MVAASPVIDAGPHVTAVLFALGQKDTTVVKNGVPHDDHFLGEVLDEAEETSFHVEPGVRRELLSYGLDALDDARHTEVIVALKNGEYFLYIFLYY